MQSGIYALADYDVRFGYHAQQFLRLLQKQPTALAEQPLPEGAVGRFRFPVMAASISPRRTSRQQGPLRQQRKLLAELRHRHL